MAVYAMAKKGKFPYKAVKGRGLCVAEEDYQTFMGRKFSRQFSKFNGAPLYGEGEISVMQCAKLFGKNLATVYSHLQKGKIPHLRRGRAYVLDYDQCMKYFNKYSGKQMEFFA